MTFSFMFYFSVEGTEPPVSKKHKSEEVDNETKDVQPSEPSIPTETSQPGMTFAQHIMVMPQSFFILTSRGKVIAEESFYRFHTQKN